MPRPSTPPDFATDDDFPAGSDDWSGQPNKVDPGGLVSTGFIPEQLLKVEHFNYQFGHIADWIDFIRGADGFDDFETDYEEFDAGSDPVIVSAAGLIYPGSCTKYTEQAGNPNVRVAGDDTINARGFVEMRTADGDAVSSTLSGSHWLIATTTDYAMKARLIVPDRTHLETNANDGLRIGCTLAGGAVGAGFRCGKTLTYWEVLKPDGTVQAPTTQVSVATGSTFQILLVARIGGTINWYVDGTLIYTTSDSATAIMTRSIVMKTSGTVGIDNVYVRCDYQRLRFKPNTF
jgi:hypothetical protein